MTNIQLPDNLSSYLFPQPKRHEASTSSSSSKNLFADYFKSSTSDITTSSSPSSNGTTTTSSQSSENPLQDLMTLMPELLTDMMSLMKLCLGQTSNPANPPTGAVPSTTGTGSTNGANSTAGAGSTDGASTTTGTGSTNSAISSSATGSTNSGNAKTDAIDGGGPNQVVLDDKSGKNMAISVLTSGTPANPVSKPEIIDLTPGETVDLSLPENWSGNITKSNNDPGIAADATQGEFTFNGSGNQSYYDVSDINGYNGPMTIAPTSGSSSSLVAGGTEDITDGAPSSMKQTTSSGETVLGGVDPGGDAAGDDPTNMVNYDYYKQTQEGQAYTYPLDNTAASRQAATNNLTMDFYD